MPRLPAFLLFAGIAVAAVAAPPPASLATVEAEIRRLEGEQTPLLARLQGETARQQALRAQMDAVQALNLAVLAFPERWNDARAAWPGEALRATLTACEKTAADLAKPQGDELRRRAQAARKALEALERPLKGDLSPEQRSQKLPQLLLPLSQSLGHLAQAAGDAQGSWQQRAREIDNGLVLLRLQAAALKPVAPPPRPAPPKGAP